MKNIIDIHNNILLDNPNKNNLRIMELFNNIKPNSKFKKEKIKKKTLTINKKANFKDLRYSMKKNNIVHALCFSYQWRKNSDCIKANNFIIKNIQENNYNNLSCLVVLQPKAKNSKFFLEDYISKKNVLGMKIKPSWCKIKLSETKYLGPLCETLISNNKILLTHISQGFHPNMGDNIYELSQLL